MKTLVRFLGMAALVIAMPIMAQSASAAEFRQPGAHQHGLNGHMTPAPKGVFAKVAEPKKIVVAGRRRGRWVGPVIGGIVAGALLSGAARAYDRDHHYSRRRYENRCDRWLWKCDNGERWACRKFYRHCD